MPKLPARPAPSTPGVSPWRTPITLRASPKPSTSLSLASTLPVGSEPRMALRMPPASMAKLLSLTATGVSLAPWMAIFRVARSSLPSASITV
ncbi:hypothetical protein D9M71_224400 [compost metagenome]